MLKAYPTARPETFYWIAVALSKDDHHQRWGKATLGWVVGSKRIFEKWLGHARAEHERSQRARDARDRYEREAKEQAARAGGEPAPKSNHESTAAEARAIREQLETALRKPIE